MGIAEKEFALLQKASPASHSHDYGMNLFYLKGQRSGELLRKATSRHTKSRQMHRAPLFAFHALRR